MAELLDTMCDVILMVDDEFEYFLNTFPNICNKYGVKEELTDKVMKFIIKQRNKIREAK